MSVTRINYNDDDDDRPVLQKCDPYNFVPMSKKSDPSTWTDCTYDVKSTGQDLVITDVHKKVLEEIRAKDWSNYFINMEQEWVDPVYVQDKGFCYKGQVKNMAAHGVGIYVEDSGKRYEGMFENGKFNDKNGRAFYKNGSYYIGGFKNFKFNGTGTYKYSAGKTYTGEFKDGNLHGKGNLHVTLGKFIRECGDIYEGNFYMNKFHGKGMYKYTTGKVYDGNWRYGEKDGYGSI